LPNVDVDQSSILLHVKPVEIGDLDGLAFPISLLTQLDRRRPDATFSIDDTGFSPLSPACHNGPEGDWFQLGDKD
jgi:hypothetical protein